MLRAKAEKGGGRFGRRAAVVERRLSHSPDGAVVHEAARHAKGMPDASVFFCAFVRAAASPSLANDVVGGSQRTRPRQCVTPTLPATLTWLVALSAELQRTVA